MAKTYEEQEDGNLKLLAEPTGKIRQMAIDYLYLVLELRLSKDVAIELLKLIAQGYMDRGTS